MNDAPKCEPCTHFTAAVVYQRGGWYRDKCNNCGSASRWVRSESAARYALRGKPTPYHAVVPVDELATLRTEVLGLKGAVASADEDNDALRATIREQATKSAALRAERDAAVAEVARMRPLLEECANDLAMEIEAKYVGADKYPSEAKRRDRDMEIVNLARAALTPKDKS